jgi:predicted Zn-dependent protease
MMLALAAIDLQLGKARAGEELLQQVADSYRKQGLEETAVRTLFPLPRALVDFGKTREARQLLRSLAPGRHYSEDVTIALADVGDVAQAVANTDRLDRDTPNDTITQSIRIPEMRAAINLARHLPKQAIEDLQRASSFDLRSPELMLLRGNAHLAAKQPAAAAEQFQKTIEHQFVDPMWVNAALAHLGLARARALQGDRAGARQEYEAVLTIWKDADPDLPVLLAAKAELARLGE